MTTILLEHFEEQCDPVACVTACACMVLRARGQAPDQRALHVARSENGRNVHDILSLVEGAEELDLIGDDTPTLIRAALAAGRSVVVAVNGERWMYLAALAPARRAHPTRWIDTGTFLHAVLVYAIDEGGGLFMPDDEFLCLDPYFPRGTQPIRLGAADLRNVVCRAIAC